MGCSAYFYLHKKQKNGQISDFVWNKNCRQWEEKIAGEYIELLFLDTGPTRELFATGLIQDTYIDHFMPTKETEDQKPTYCSYKVLERGEIEAIVTFYEDLQKKRDDAAAELTRLQSLFLQAKTEAVIAYIEKEIESTKQRLRSLSRGSDDFGSLDFDQYYANVFRFQVLAIWDNQERREYNKDHSSDLVNDWEVIYDAG